MPCSGFNGDYRCAGWITVTERIRKRDKNQCRGCNRHADDIRTEVHHRTYGKPGSCGNCYLTGVSDDDLITLCIECHDAITDIRRRVRYGSRPIVVTNIPDPVIVVHIDRMSSQIEPAIEKTSIIIPVVGRISNTACPEIERLSVSKPVPVRFSSLDRLMKE